MQLVEKRNLAQVEGKIKASETFLKSSVRIAIERAIIPSIAPKKEKTSSSLGNLYISNY